VRGAGPCAIINSLYRYCSQAVVGWRRTCFNRVSGQKAQSLNITSLSF